MNLHKLATLEEDVVKMIPWMLWRLWKSRNEFVFKELDYDVQEVARKPKEDAEEWVGSKKAKENHGVKISNSDQVVK